MRDGVLRPDEHEPTALDVNVEAVSSCQAEGFPYLHGDDQAPLPTEHDGGTHAIRMAQQQTGWQNGSP